MTESPWREYYGDTHDKEPNETTVFARKQFPDTGGKTALDIGSGTGCDALYLLEEGFTVTAVDTEMEALERLESRARERFGGKLFLVRERIQNYAMPAEGLDLVNASFVLPFLPKSDFDQVLKKIRRGLKPGGLFSFQLYGVNDGWAGTPGMTFLTNEEVDDIVLAWEPLYFREYDKDGLIADGSVKHWHLFNCVVRNTALL